MTKEINVEEAKKWDDEEAALNDRYLRDRGRDAEADRALELRGGTPTGPSGDAVPEGNIDEVMAWVGDDPARAQQALDAENDSANPRVTLVESLEAKIAG